MGCKRRPGEYNLNSDKFGSCTIGSEEEEPVSITPEDLNMKIS